MAIAVNPMAPGGPTREYRASAAFLIAAAFMLVILLLVVGSVSTGPPARWVVPLVGPVVLMLILFATAVGLAQRATWATVAMTPLLYLLVVSGAISFVLGLLRSTLEVPLGLILAVWALRAPPSTASLPLGRVATAVVATALAAALWALPSEFLLRPGGPLVLDASALEHSLQVSCTAPHGAEPARIHVRYDWRWLRSEPLAGGQDQITVEVHQQGTDSGPIALALDETDPLPSGISQQDISIFPPLGMTFGVDLATTGFGPQSVGFGLIGPSSQGSGVVTVDARYRHGAASSTGTGGIEGWSAQTSVDCEW
jgi:hypothetical protein